MILVCVLFPLGVIGQLYIPILKTIYTSTFALIVIGQIIAGIFYSKKLTNILSQSKLDDKKRNAIANVKYVIVRSVSITILTLIAQGTRVSFLKGPFMNLWVYLFVSNVCIPLTIMLVAYSVSFKSRMLVKHEIAPATKISSTNTNNTAYTSNQTKTSVSSQAKS
jgi:hypothetical protein